MVDDVNASAASMQFVLIALIASHPNKKELLLQFDKISSEHNVAAVSVGETLHPEVRKAMMKYRALIETFL